MRDFFKYAAASALGTVVGLAVLLALLGIGATGLIAVLLTSASQEPQPKLDKKSVLVFDLSTDIQDAVPPSGAEVVLEEALSGSANQAISIKAALDGLEKAAQDDNIVGLFLTGNTGSGFATLQELHQAIAAFKAQGKPVMAYAVDWSERDYYLTSIADEVILNPAGMLELNGFQAETQFLGGALKKYGIGVQVLRAGRYKSAVEPFERTESSPEDREQTQALLADLWQEFLKTTGESREVTPQVLQSIAEKGGLLMADEAKTAGLIDQVAYYDEVLGKLYEMAGVEPEESDSESAQVTEEDLPQIDLVAYSQLTAGDPAKTSSNQVAVVYAAGEIVGGEGGDGVIGSDSLNRTLREMRANEDVKAVVLRINSPGGGATASEEIAREVKRLSETKPVIISMGNLAASGGYMIATGGNQIFASSTTITGSIGVFGLLFNFKEIANTNGVTWDVVKTAKFADIQTVARPLTPEEFSLQQGIVLKFYDRFLSLVADSRDLTKTNVDQVAQGRVWSGIDAKGVKLVDQIGGLNDAIAAAAKAAGLEEWSVEEYPKPITLEEQIFESIFGDIAVRVAQARNPVLREVESIQEDLQIFQQLDDPNQIYMRLPITTEIK